MGYVYGSTVLVPNRYGSRVREAHSHQRFDQFALAIAADSSDPVDFFGVHEETRTRQHRTTVARTLEPRDTNPRAPPGRPGRPAWGHDRGTDREHGQIFSAR